MLLFCSPKFRTIKYWIIFWRFSLIKKIYICCFYFIHLIRGSYPMRCSNSIKRMAIQDLWLQWNRFVLSESHSINLQIHIYTSNSKLFTMNNSSGGHLMLSISFRGHNSDLWTCLWTLNNGPPVTTRMKLHEICCPGNKHIERSDSPKRQRNFMKHLPRTSL